ncbi:interleukin-31 receptor subunit alpha-like [Discoglossus pictus]
MPKEICDLPKILSSMYLPNYLRLQLDNDGEVRYREITSPQWHLVNTTNKTINIQLQDSQTVRSFIAQQRCSKIGCFQCKWGAETAIPRKLTETPIITLLTTEGVSLGKQKVSVKWKFAQSDYVDGYTVTVERLPNSCNTVYSMNLSNTELQLNLSMATFNISINAFNKAGSSPPVSSMVPLLSRQDYPGTIYATAQNNTIFLTWSPKSNCDFFIINWGTNITQMKSVVLKDNYYYSLKGPFERMKRYTIMIHTYETCACGNNVSVETTFGLTYIYAEEGVPITGPAKITIPFVTKHSALIQWQEIPEEDCMGFLTGYRIFYTDNSTNTTQDIFVNSSSSTSYQIMGLTREKTYTIQISGTTSKGDGIRSLPHVFKTLKYDEKEFEIILIQTCIVIIIFVTISVGFCAYTFHRTKYWYFPKIPNPKHSNIVKMSGETTAMNSLMPSLLVSHEEGNCDTAQVEVTQEVKIVPNQCIHEKEALCTLTRKDSAANSSESSHTRGNPEAKHKAPNTPVPNDYTNIMFMLKAAKKMTHPFNHEENMINVNRSQPTVTIQEMQRMLTFHDYVKENRTDTPSKT